MAQSRLEKIGTIFSRVSGIIQRGALKPEDKPIWYDVYAAFPPKLEPRYDRPAPNLPLRNIYYNEDKIRAKYHKSLRNQETLNLSDSKHQTNCQQYISIYNKLKNEGALDDEKIFEVAKDMLDETTKNRLQVQDKNEMEKDFLVKNFTSASNTTQTTIIKDIFNQN